MLGYMEICAAFVKPAAAKTVVHFRQETKISALSGKNTVRSKD
jgi:hypothetical protein